MRFNVAGIVADGAMARATADAFIDGDERATTAKAISARRVGSCRRPIPIRTARMKEGGYNCSGSPMGGLYYHHLLKMLGVQAGRTRGRAPDIALGPIPQHPAVSLLVVRGQRQPDRRAAARRPRPGFEWSFSFGNGFQGTDVIGNTLYVMVYAPDPELVRWCYR